MLQSLKNLASSVIGLIYILAFTWKVMWTSPKSDLEGAIIWVCRTKSEPLFLKRMLV